MDTSLVFPALQQLRRLLLRLDHDNYKASLTELRELCTVYGDSANAFVLTHLLSSIDFTAPDVRSMPDNQLRLPLAQQIIMHLVKTNPAWTTLACGAFDTLHATGVHITAQYIETFCSVVQLELQYQIALGLALVDSSIDDVRLAGEGFVNSQLVQLIAHANKIKADSKTSSPAPPKMPDQVLHGLLSYVLLSSNHSRQQEQQVGQALTEIYPAAALSFLAPLLLSEPEDRTRASPLSSESSLLSSVSSAHAVCTPAQLLQDLGPCCMRSVANLRSILSHFPRLSVTDVAAIVVMLVRSFSHRSTDADSALPLSTIFQLAINSATSNAHAVEPIVEGKVPGNGGWCVEVFVQTMRELYPRLRWSDVYLHLDRPSMFVPDYKAFLCLVNIYKQATDGAAFPVDVFFSSWTNKSGQLSVLSQVIKAPADIVNLLHSERALKLPSGHSSVLQFKNVAAQDAHKKYFHQWYSIDLIESLLKLSETHRSAKVRALFGPALKKAPKVLFLSLVAVNNTARGVGIKTELGESLLQELLIPLLEHKSASNVAVLRHVWDMYPVYLMNWMTRLWANGKVKIATLANVVSGYLDGMSQVLASANSVVFRLELLAFSPLSASGFIANKLKPSINDALTFLSNIQQASQSHKRESVATALLHRLHAQHVQHQALDLPCRIRLHSLSKGVPSFLEGSQLEASSLATHAMSGKLSAELVVSTIHNLRAAETDNQNGQVALSGLVIAHIMSRATHSGAPQVSGTLMGELALHSVLTSLELRAVLAHVSTGLQHVSTESREFLVAAAALTRMESVVATKFPEFAAATLGLTNVQTLFPAYVERVANVLGLTQHGIEYKRQMLDAAPRDHVNSNSAPAASAVALSTADGQTMHTPVWVNNNQQVYANNKFEAASHIPVRGSGSGSENNAMHTGVIPSYQAPLSQKESKTGLTGFGGNLGVGFAQPNNYVPRSNSANNNNSSSNGNNNTASSTANTGMTPGKRLKGSSVKADTLLAAQNKSKQIVSPPEGVKDKIHFIINNIDQMNFVQKAEDMKGFLKEKFYAYLCQYLVIRRVSVEMNFQKAYAMWLDEMKLPKLKKCMIETTYNNVLILTSNTLKTSSERSLLKNLGSWLGILTVANNVPILAKYLNLKELLLKAYEADRLAAVIPFVTKILEHCANSKVLRMPNPWFTRLMCLFRELYEFPDLKLNSTFAIEVLFNELNINAKDIPVTRMLASCSRKGEKTAVTASPDLDGMPSSPQFGPDQAGNPAASGNLLVPAQYIFINPSLTWFAVYPQLKRLMGHALDHAIKEILSPVVKRSVTIACVTAKNLIIKDFAFEPDEAKMRRAAHAMVKTMTASLAVVTCKEHLREAITKHVSKLLETNANVNPQQIEHACGHIANDNLRVCCNVVRMHAAEHAVREIDEILAPMYAARRKHRASAHMSATPFADLSVVNSAGGRFATTLPEPLRPTPGGLTAAQLKVYDDFSMLHPTAAQGQSAVDKTNKSPVHAPLAAPNQVDKRSIGPVGGMGPPPDAQPLEAKSEVQINRLTAQQCIDKLISCMHNLNHSVNSFRSHRTTRLSSLIATNNRAEDHEVIRYLRMIPAVLNVAPKDEPLFNPEMVAFSFAHKVFKSLYEPSHLNSLLHIDVHLAILKSVASIAPKLVNELTAWLLGTDDDQKFKLDLLVGMCKHRLLYMHEVDMYFSKLLHLLMVRNQVFVVGVQGGNNNNRTRRIHPKLEFVINFVRRVICKAQAVHAHELSRLCERIGNMAQSYANHPSDLQTILSHLLRDVNMAAMQMEREREDRKRLMSSSVPGDGEPNDRDVEFVLQMSRVNDASNNSANSTKPIIGLFQGWMSICLQGNASDKTYAKYLSMLQQQRVLNSPESSIRFFRVVTRLCVEDAFKQPQKGPQMQRGRLSYTAIDALAKLVVFLVKFLDPTGTNNPQNKNPATKIRILSLFLNSVAWSLLKEYELKREHFNQKPYLRLFTNLLHDLNTPDPSLDSNNTDVLLAFARVFTILRPTRVPGFVFAWLELVSHRMFMPKMLIRKKPQCAHAFRVMLVDLFKLMRPHLASGELAPPIKLLYRGTLRVLLVLLHDFPEFLCEFHFSFCDVIPVTCVQIRNLILSAFPRNMRLPDPFTPNLKVDALPDIGHPPRIASDVLKTLESFKHELLVPLDVYLKTRQPGGILQQLPHILTLHPNAQMTPQDVQRAIQQEGTKYNVPLINSLVMYIGGKGIVKLQQAKNQNPKTTTADGVKDTPYMDVFVALVKLLDGEGRYYLLNAIVNQLRYPNNHTHYFSCVLLSLFLHADESIVKEQITRVLLERLIVHRPHPWGLLITFIELIKNPIYDFLQQPFTRLAPEIEKLFESVARSCVQNSLATNDKQSSGGKSIQQ